MKIDDVSLIAGHPALDFVNSVEGRGSAELLNYLPDYDRLIQWCLRADLLAPSDGVRLRREAKKHPIRAERAWRDAMDLRDCLNDLFRAQARSGARSGAKSDAPPQQSVLAFNAVVERAFAHRRLHLAKGGRFSWIWGPDKVGPDKVGPDNAGLEIPAWEIALAATDLLTDDGRSHRIKICANGPCDWMFLDMSPSGRRHWCRMAVCGNASKVRRFRQRHDTAS